MSNILKNVLCIAAIYGLSEPFINQSAAHNMQRGKRGPKDINSAHTKQREARMRDSIQKYSELRQYTREQTDELNAKLDEEMRKGEKARAKLEARLASDNQNRLDKLQKQLEGKNDEFTSKDGAFGIGIVVCLILGVTAIILMTACSSEVIKVDRLYDKDGEDYMMYDDAKITAWTAGEEGKEGTESASMAFDGSDLKITKLYNSGKDDDTFIQFGTDSASKTNYLTTGSGSAMEKINLTATGTHDANINYGQLNMTSDDYNALAGQLESRITVNNIKFLNGEYDSGDTTKGPEFVTLDTKKINYIWTADAAPANPGAITFTAQKANNGGLE